MDFEAFNQRVEVAKVESSVVFATIVENKWLDAPASDEDIARVEQILGAVLPTDYVLFLKKYGGGTFFYTDIFSAQPKSDWYIVKNQPRLKSERDFVAFSENGCGDYYGFKVNGGTCEPEVMFWDHEENGAVFSIGYPDILNFLVRKSLKQEIL